MVVPDTMLAGTTGRRTGTAVNISTSGATIPNVRIAYTSGNTQSIVSGDVPAAEWVRYHASHAAASAIQIAGMRLGAETSSSVWQCGHSRLSVYAVNNAAEIGFMQ